MKVIAYLYSDPLLETTTETTLPKVDRIYQDLGSDRTQLKQLISENESVQLQIRRW